MDYVLKCVKGFLLWSAIVCCAVGVLYVGINHGAYINEIIFGESIVQGIEPIKLQMVGPSALSM